MSRIVSLLIIILFTAGAHGAVRGESHFRLQSSQYVSQGQNFFREGARGDNTSFAFGVDGRYTWRKVNFVTTARNEFSASENWNYLNVHQLYAQTGSERTQIALGRKREAWTEWEQLWTQGVFEPRYMQNRLRPEFAGLTGVFATHKQGKARVTAAVLPIHIPDLGPRFWVSNYQFVSPNPWFSAPASKFVYRGQEGDLRYSADTPEVGEVVFNPGAAAKFEWRETHYLSRLSYAYKPMPQFLFGFPSRDQVTVTPQGDFMSIVIQPRLVYHHLASMDHVVKVGAWDLSGSLTHERPVGGEGPESSTRQQVAPAWIYAASVSRALEREGPMAARARLGVLYVEGGDAPDAGDFAGRSSLFEPRYHYREAMVLALSKPFRSGLRFPLLTEARVLYDRAQNGGVVSLNASLPLSRQLRADFELDLLGLVGSNADVQDGFLSIYRANDRVGLGVSYVF